MASILDKYGIKEVCNVTFYALDDNGKPMYPVLYLDTLKVSTVEQTAEESTATGGVGNATLISWDHTKDITVTLEDALFSPKSMAVMFGDPSQIGVETTAQALIMKTEVFTCTKDVATISTALEGDGIPGWNKNYTAPDGRIYAKVNPKFYAEDASGQRSDDHQLTALKKDTKYFCTYDLRVAGSVINVSADSFPGTYYVVGETYARSEASGRDEFFQLIFPKAKVTSENTITMEADGDPSVFNLNLHVLRATDGSMMKLIKYDLADKPGAATDTSIEVEHNHILDKADTAALGTDEKVPAAAATISMLKAGASKPPVIAKPLS